MWKVKATTNESVSGAHGKWEWALNMYRLTGKMFSHWLEYAKHNIGATFKMPSIGNYFFTMMCFYRPLDLCWIIKVGSLSWIIKKANCLAPLFCFQENGRKWKLNLSINALWGTCVRKTFQTRSRLTLRPTSHTTERGGLSFPRFWRQAFGEFPRLVGHYCSYLLPKQDGGTSQILVFKTLRMTGRPTV